MCKLSLKHGILGLLTYQPMTGYDVGKLFNRSLSFFWQCQTSQIYRELNTMETLKWVSSNLEIQTTKPNKKIYTITNEGKEELIRWVSEMNIASAMTVKSEFLMKLFFFAKIDKSLAINVLSAFASACEQALAQMQSVNTQATNENEIMDAIFWEMTCDFGRTYYEACIDWALRSIKVLTDC